MCILNKITDLLEEQNKKQRDLTDFLGISKNVFTDWKSGRNKSYNKYLPQIADFFNCSVDCLLGKETISTPQYPSEDIVYFEIIGSVKAGYDGLAVEEHTGETTPIPSFFLNNHDKEDFFVLRVSGNSMYPKMIDGDLVLVQRTSSVDSGSIAVVLYEDNATIKKVRYVTGEDWLELIPANPEYETKLIEGKDLEQCRVLGKVVKLIRDL